jgi:hypothetical protein
MIVKMESRIIVIGLDKYYLLMIYQLYRAGSVQE